METLHPVSGTAISVPGVMAMVLVTVVSRQLVSVDLDLILVWLWNQNVTKMETWPSAAPQPLI